MILVKDLTIEEISQICDEHTYSCSGCPLRTEHDGVKDCALYCEQPYKWDINWASTYTVTNSPVFDPEDFHTWTALDVRKYCDSHLCANCRFRRTEFGGCQFLTLYPCEYTGLIRPEPEPIVTTEIYWHKYPENKPRLRGRKLVSLSNGTVREAWWANNLGDTEPTFIVGGHYIDELIIDIEAWADMPQQYSAARRITKPLYYGEINKEDNNED